MTNPWRRIDLPDNAAVVELLEQFDIAYGSAICLGGELAVSIYGEGNTLYLSPTAIALVESRTELARGSSSGPPPASAALLYGAAWRE